MNCDAYHVTSPIPEGDGARRSECLASMTDRCMEMALRNANVPVEAVGYLNAHATSTQIGDKAEMMAISRVFQNCQKNLRISSTKGATGHLLGAAGAIEAGICAYSLAHVRIREWNEYEGKAPGTLNLKETDIDYGFNLIREQTSITGEYAISNSFGFGGVNVSLLLKRILVVC